MKRKLMNVGISAIILSTTFLIGSDKIVNVHGENVEENIVAFKSPGILEPIHPPVLLPTDGNPLT